MFISLQEVFCRNFCFLAETKLIYQNTEKENEFAMIFESHAHYDDNAFDKDRHLLLPEMHKNGIGYIINVTADWESLLTTKRLTEQYDYVYGTVGIHPGDVENLTEERIASMMEYGKLDKIVAVGEIGLDYYYPEPEKDIQKKWFARQLTMAGILGLPVIIHSRDASSDTLEIMKRDSYKALTGVIHCYSYSKETAKAFLNMGYYFGIGGVVTFQNAKKLVETVEYLPMDRILLETDSPYLAPVPNRGKRNSSLNLPYIAETIANIKGISSEEVIVQTCKNAKRLFSKIE